MENLPRLTRSRSHKLLCEKSLPNRLQRLSNGGYKRKADFLTLGKRKWTKRIHPNGPEPVTNSYPYPPTENTKKPSDENTNLEKGTPASPSLCPDLEIVVALPLPPASFSPPDTLKAISGISHSETLDSASLKLSSHSEALAQENGGVCSENTLSTFEAFNLDLTLDTDSEDQIAWPQWDLSRNSLPDAEGIDIKSREDYMGFAPVKPLGISDVNLDKVPDPGKADVQVDLPVYGENSPLLRPVKEEPPDSSAPTEGCCSEPCSVKDSEKETEGWKEKHVKGVCRLGPGSRRLFSVSRLADFLRSTVEIINIDDDEHAAKIDSKVRAHQKKDAAQGGCNAGPAKKQLTKLPGQRKVTLSPGSQLKLLEASNISSYRRMLPFCTEMAKDLARTSFAQSTPKTLSTTVCVASKECDTHIDEVSDRECLSLEHVSAEQSERQSDLVSTDCRPNNEPIPLAHVKLEYYESQMELFPSDKCLSKEPLCTEHVKLEQNESQSDSVPGNEDLRSKSFSFELVKLEQPDSQSEAAPSDGGQGWGSLFVDHVKPEENESQPDSASNDQGFSGDSLLIEHVNSEQHGYQSKPSPASQSESSDDLEKNVVPRFSTNSTTSLFFNEHCPSPLPVQNPSTSDADNVFLAEHKSPPPSLPGPADFSRVPTCGEIPSMLDTPASVPSKGILRVSPRSCKGACMCSDCALFRLHAEKASDFAERQLREVEALAVPLMNELASMRMLMERSLIMKPKGAGLPYAIHSEVKGASKSALKVEETARNHLMQITRDTNLHCKIMRMQQRRVKFADKIEVKLFQSE